MTLCLTDKLLLCLLPDNILPFSILSNVSASDKFMSKGRYNLKELFQTSSLVPKNLDKTYVVICHSAKPFFIKYL